MIAEQAQRMLVDMESLKRSRAVLESDGASDDELWGRLVELGITGTTIPEEYGGVGLGYLELCLLAEQLGRVLAPVPFSSTVYLFAEALLRFGGEEQKKAWLPKVAGEGLVGTLAVAETYTAATEQSIGCELSGGKLTGGKIAVPDGAVAAAAVVVAREGGKCRLCLVDLSGDGVSRETEEVLDGSRPSASLTFAGADAQVLGSGGDGWEQLQELLNRAAVPLAFEQLGGADAAMEMARDYALERYAFGRPIGSYQAVKHRLADMYIHNQLARSNCYYGAWALQNDAPDLDVASATARVSATQAFDFASQENIQLHGGMGFTWEFDCHLFYRRAKYLAVALGGLGEWKDRLVGGLERSNRAADR